MWQVQERATLESVDYTLKVHLDGKADLFFFIWILGLEKWEENPFLKSAHTHTHISHLSSLYFKITLRNMYVLYLLEHFVL